MIDLKKSVYQKLKTITNNVYDNKTPANVSYPYVNTRYVTASENFESHVLRCVLEIDIWDNIRDTTRLEELTDTIDATINRYMDSDLHYYVFRQNPYRFELDDQDEKLNRRQIRYLIHYVKN